MSSRRPTKASTTRWQTRVHPRDNYYHCTGSAWRTSLFRSVCWFTSASYRRFSHATTSNVSRGWQTSSRTSASMQLPLSRGMLYGLDRSGCMAFGWDKCIDLRQPQRAGGARAGMRDRCGPRPVARAWPGSSVQGDSYRGVRSETIPQLGEVSPDAPMRPLPAMAAGSCGGRGRMGAPD